MAVAVLVQRIAKTRPGTLVDNNTTMMALANQQIQELEDLTSQLSVIKLRRTGRAPSAATLKDPKG